MKMLWKIFYLMALKLVLADEAQKAGEGQFSPVKNEADGVNHNPLTINSENCVKKHVQESCHPCSQTEFQLNVDECQTTHHIEKIICSDSDSHETVIVQSCSSLARGNEQNGVFSFCVSNFIIGLFAFYCSRKRQRFLDDKRNRRLQTQLQALQLVGEGNYMNFFNWKKFKMMKPGYKKFKSFN